MAISVSWYEYAYNFPVSGITTFTTFLTGARAAHFLDGGYHLPDNMLGDPRDATGAVVTATDANGALVGVVFRGRTGIPAMSYTDPNGNTVNVARVGDPTLMYLNIRAPYSPAQLAAILTGLHKTLAQYGVTATDPALSAQILGTWM